MSLTRILHDLDSIREFNDSVGHAYYHDAKAYTFNTHAISKTDSLKIVKELAKEETNIDTLYLKLKGEQKQAVIRQAASDAQMALSNLDFKSEYSYCRVSSSSSLEHHWVRLSEKVDWVCPSSSLYLCSSSSTSLT